MQLRVDGLSHETAEADIRKLFSNVCAVASVSVVRDIESGRSLGLAIVKTHDEPGCARAIEMLNGSTVQGKLIAVRKMPDTLPGEMEFREWLTGHAALALTAIGVSRGQTVLDYGCGPGILTIPCAQIVGETGKVYALDVRRDLLEGIKLKAKTESLSNIETMLSDGSRLNIDLPDESLDLVLVYDVMHGVKDRPGLLHELHRLMRTSGILSIYPMHLGTNQMIGIVRESHLFSLRSKYGPPKYEGASEILNFIKSPQQSVSPRSDSEG